MSKPVTAVIYARYSSAGQNDASIDQQVQACRTYADQNGYTVVDTYADHAISGRTDDRPAFQRMISDSSKGAFTHVICYHVDRFARNRYDSAMYKAKLKKNGVKVVYAQSSIPDTAEGIILESVMEGYAEYYSANLGIHTRRGMHDAAKKHRALHMPPFGYRINTAHQYEPDPMLSDAVLHIFSEYAAGKRVVDICEWLNTNGYTTGNGKPFGRSSLKNILTSKMYIGTYEFGDVSDPDVIQPTISKELFEKVQEALKRNSIARAHHKATEEYTLSGKIFCGECGSTMIGKSGTSSTGTVYRYYVCSDREKKNGTCRKSNEKKELLESAVVRAVIDTILTDEVIADIADRTVRLLEEELRRDNILPELESRQAEISAQKKRLVKYILMQDDPAEALNETLKDLDIEAKQLEKRIEQEKAKHRLTLTADDVTRWLDQFRNGDVNDPEYCRRIVDLLVSAVYVYDDTDDPDNAHIVITCNTTANRKIKLSYSDVRIPGVEGRHTSQMRTYTVWPYYIAIDTTINRRI